MSAQTAGSDAARVDALATAYVDAWFARYPEQLTSNGIPGARHDRLTDRSLAALERWRRQEDAWLSEVRRIDPETLEGRPEWATYGILRETLEGTVAQRACRLELWGLNTSGGWQAGLSSLARAQPVGSDSLRAQALARWRAVPELIETDAANLRVGLRHGYVAPRPVVEGVIRQLDGLLATTPDASPYASPAQRDSSPEFRRAFVATVARRINPAIRRYRRFLASEYLPRARETIGVAEIPDGLACYRAAVRRYTTLDLPPDSIFERGTRELARLEARMSDLGRRRFGTGDVPALLQRLKEDTAFTFDSRQEIIDSSEAAVARATAAAPKWFGLLPRAQVVIEEYPEFRQRAGAVPSYQSAAEDGSRPGIFYINTWDPEKQSRARIESTAFHEAVPGHHFQVTIAQERAGSHPIARYVYNSGYAEGWALYAETVAGEMDLFSSDLGRLGLLASQALRAVRLVLDAGIHAKGWTRAQAAEFMAAHTVVSPGILQGEIDRYISVPGQASSYMLGNLEIRALRTAAEQALGDRFDVREFHDRVLEDGALPLPVLRQKIERWMAAGGSRRE
ncbi:MAG TPA: DUF885 domain-containing protein [Gemmatimonadales bacterium]|nr:DUF885 domain-containing protein [Gemmatimonadales bacterium]